jgi:DinB superfamily
MKTSAFALAIALGVVPAVAAAQASSMSQSPSSSNPVSDAMRANERRMATNLVAAIELFPADKFVYKPTAGQMTVGEIAVHLIEGNDMLCSTVGGTTAPQRAALTATAPKDQLVARLRETFQYCETALAGLTDAKMGDMVPSFGGRQATRGSMVLVTVGDWADHYSQLANYLRLNNMLPPTARGRGM